MQGFGGTEDKDGDVAVETVVHMGGTSKKVSLFSIPGRLENKILSIVLVKDGHTEERGNCEEESEMGAAENSSEPVCVS